MNRVAKGHNEAGVGRGYGKGLCRIPISFVILSLEMLRRKGGQEVDSPLTDTDYRGSGEAS